MKIHLRLLSLLVTALAMTSCFQDKGNEFYTKNAGFVGGGDQSSPGDGLLPPPDDEPEKDPGSGDGGTGGDVDPAPPSDGGGDEEKDPGTGDGGSDGDGDHELPKPPGAPEKECPVKFYNSKIKSGEVDIDDIACDEHKVAICHKASCNEKNTRYKLVYVDRHAINAHVEHHDRKDFLIDCKKVQVINTVLNRKALDDACNCE